MKFKEIELRSGKNTPFSSSKNVILPILTLFLLTLFPLYFFDTSPSLVHSPGISNNANSIPTRTENNSSSPLQSLLKFIDHTVTNSSNPLYDHQKNESSSPFQSPAITANNSASLFKSIVINNIKNSNPFSEKTTQSSTLQYYSGRVHIKDDATRSVSSKLRGCNIFKGRWVRYPKGSPYYTNETKCVIDDRQNCVKLGRPDTEFLKWRWKPYKCELPLFDAVQLLELVRGKTLAFVGDSVGRNQMQSLVCLLASAAEPVDVSYTPDTRFRRWLYTEYNFTIAALWSPLLVKSDEADSQSYLMNIYLDQSDEAWASQIENIDIAIISAGQWFFRPFVYYQKGKIVGCRLCNKKNVKELHLYYGYKMAFRTAFRTLLGLKKFKGLTFLRTFSPAHFEHGGWGNGGYCGRTRPFTEKEMRLDGFNLEFYRTQLKELRAAEKKGRKRGLQFRLLDTTEAMVLRPDGHPNHYGHWPSDDNKTTADCVHWCLPGPIDTWNELLLQVLKIEKEGQLISPEEIT